jgi:hypothetical protein
VSAFMHNKLIIHWAELDYFPFGEESSNVIGRIRIFFITSYIKNDVFPWGPHFGMLITHICKNIKKYLVMLFVYHCDF